MRLREVFRYELEHRLRRPSTWLYAGFLFLLAAWMFLATADGDGLANAPERLAGGSAAVGMVGMLVTAALFGGAAVRDVEVGMDPILFTTPLRKAEYLGGRFLAALALNAALVPVIPLGFLAATRLLGSFDSEEVGPFRAGAFLQPIPLFLLPNLVLSGSILFALGVLARKVVPVYLSALGLFVGYLVALNALDRVENPLLLVLCDPLGIHALQATTRLWTEVERNTRLIGLPAALLLNRAWWLAVAAGVLLLLHWRFQLAHVGLGGRRRKATRELGEACPELLRPLEVPRVAGAFGFRTCVRQALGVAHRSLAETVASRWFALVLLACTALTVLLGFNVGQTVFDTSTWPVTLLVAGTVLAERIAPVLYALSALYAGELVWKDRTAHVDEIVDATPVTEGVALLGQLLALVGILALLQVALLLGGLLIQALNGYWRLELGLYLRILFGLNLPGLVLFGVLAMTIQVLVNHRYLGHVVVASAVLSVLALRMLGVLEHHLLIYGTDPGWVYSDMNGFGPYVGPIVWFKLYWAAWALMLMVVAVLFWVRGRERGLRRRLDLACARLDRPLARAAGAAALLIVGLGGFIFYNTNVLNEHLTRATRGAAQAEYERRYARYETLAQPTIADVQLRVEIHPDAPAVEQRGAYRLENRTGGAIEAVHVVLERDLEVHALTLERAAGPAQVDDEVGYRIFQLERALEPGDSLQLAFDVAYRPRGFPNSGIQRDVVANGAHFHRHWLPFIGYQPMFALDDAEARERFDLPPLPAMPGPDDVEARGRRFAARDADLVHVDAVVGTAADQVAVTPGVLQRSWTENGRRYFHYETEAPIPFGGTIFSASYAVLEDRWNDIALQVFHHPAHGYNLDRMVRSMKASLAYFTAQFGPYPDSQLRIVEFPRYGGFGHAHPHTIAFAEDAFLSRVREGEVDQPFFGTAHEIAHQWWGGMARGAPVRGAAFLSESLANYSAMMVVEKTYGPAMARRVYHFQMERYLAGRAAFGREVPLLEVEDQPYVAYRRGAVALYTLRERLGEEAVNTALRRYLERFREAGPPYPTSLDLFDELRAVTPAELQHLLTDLFETITLWEVRTERAVVDATETGEFRVTLEVQARKVRADGVGNETEAPMDELVEIGVFAPGAGDDLGEPLHLEPHRIRSGAQTIHITVPREPEQAGIDPYHKLIERQGDDNVVEVRESRANPAGAGPRRAG